MPSHSSPIPLAPRALPDWFVRLELTPRKHYFHLSAMGFLICLFLFSYWSARQLSFENKRQNTVVISAKVLQIQPDRFQFEIYEPELIRDIHYVLTEVRTPPPSLKVGDRIQVYYFAKNPSQSFSEFAVVDYYTFIFGGGVGCFLFFFSTLFWGRKYFRLKEAYQQGEPVEAKVVFWSERESASLVTLEAENPPLLAKCRVPRYVPRHSPNTKVLGIVYEQTLLFYRDSTTGFVS